MNINEMETELDNTIVKTYTLFQKHIDYLNTISPNNHSIALRTSIDRLIETDRKKKTTDYIDGLKDNILIISIGMIFFLFGSIASTLLISITSLGIGIFFASYGIFTIPFKKHKKTK